MKLLISFFVAIAAGCCVRGLTLAFEGYRRPSPDFLTLALKRFAEKSLLPCRAGWIRRYSETIHPLIVETPLPGEMDVPLFLGTHLLSAALAGALTAYFLPVSGWIFIPLTASAGGAAPYFWLLQQRARFHTQLLKAMPEWLELLALVMEAGLDLSAGIQHYLKKSAPGPLHRLLTGVQRDTQMGRSRTEALATLAEKTSFAPLRDVCRSLIQALTLGSSLAPLLREQAAALRLKRMHIAEKKAAEAPLKVLFPLFVFIVPTVFMVLFGPVAMLFFQGGF